jgi:hypothetical protein
MTKLNNPKTEQEFLDEYYSEYLTQYEEWQGSESYLQYIMDEIILHISVRDIKTAIELATSSIVIDINEVGKDVYDKLVSEKVGDYLIKLRNNEN